MNFISNFKAMTIPETIHYGRQKSYYLLKYKAFQARIGVENAEFFFFFFFWGGGSTWLRCWGVGACNINKTSQLSFLPTWHLEVGSVVGYCYPNLILVLIPSFLWENPDPPTPFPPFFREISRNQLPLFIKRTGVTTAMFS